MVVELQAQSAVAGEGMKKRGRGVCLNRERAADRGMAAFPSPPSYLVLRINDCGSRWTMYSNWEDAYEEYLMAKRNYTHAFIYEELGEGE